MITALLVAIGHAREDAAIRGLSFELPGIYQWSVGDGTYIGKYTHASRPLHEYRRNIEKLLLGRPYRPQKPDGYRLIHRTLAEAVNDGRKIVLRLLENVELHRLHEREQELIAALKPNLNGNAIDSRASSSPGASRRVGDLLFLGSKEDREMAVSDTKGIPPSAQRGHARVQGLIARGEQPFRTGSQRYIVHSMLLKGATLADMRAAGVNNPDTTLKEVKIRVAREVFEENGVFSYRS